jgi:hypothetical protein
MIRDIRRKYYEVWGNEEAQNAFLKGLLVGLSILFALQSVIVCILSFRKPVLIAVEKSETQIIQSKPPSEEILSLELKRVVQSYLEAHYNWDPSTIESAHQLASQYVSEELIKAFKLANAEQVKLAKEKKLSQKVYIANLQVDSKSLTARGTLDRILMVDGLRAASVLTLEIHFQYGPRTTNNPEGIYITEEKAIN